MSRIDLEWGMMNPYCGLTPIKDALDVLSWGVAEKGKNRNTIHIRCRIGISFWQLKATGTHSRHLLTLEHNAQGQQTYKIIRLLNKCILI
jgi:hypothetical protein